MQILEVKREPIEFFTLEDLLICLFWSMVPCAFFLLLWIFIAVFFFLFFTLYDCLNVLGAFVCFARHHTQSDLKINKTIKILSLFLVLARFLFVTRLTSLSKKQKEKKH